MSAISPQAAIFAAFSASLVGIGLARFAYTPLIPPLIDEGWFTASAAHYLGAANLAGYLAGALAGAPLARRQSVGRLIRALMALAATAFFACAFPLSFAWFFLWRFAAGFSGGALMVLAAPSMLPSVPPERRGLASGAIFAGVGLGIALSGTFVPLLLRAGLATTWLALGLMASGLTLAAWRIWPDRMLGTGAAPRPAPRSSQLLALYVLYALCAVGLVPHMVFLVDYVARGLGRGLGEGALLWVVFGCAACAGPLVTGWLADRLGVATTLRLGLVVTAGCVALPALSDALPSLVVSSLVTGAFVPGVVPLALGRVQALTPPDVSARAAAWGIATACFALGQAAAAYALSFLFAQGGGYEALFALGGAALLLAAAIDVAGGRTRGA